MLKALLALVSAVLIFIILTSILIKNEPKSSKNVENVLKSVEAYLPGNQRPTNDHCFDAIDYDYYNYTTTPVFVCQLTNITVYGTMNLITSVHIKVQSELRYGDLLAMFGLSAKTYAHRRGVVWLWANNTLIATTNQTSMNPLYLPIRTLYLNEQ